MARPNRKAYALTFSALVIFLVGSNIQAGWLYVLGASLLGAVLGGLLGPSLAVRNVSVNRKGNAITRVGDSTHITLSLFNNSRTNKVSLMLVDRFISETKLVAKSLKARTRSVFEYDLVPMRRGVLSGGSLIVSSGFPFGMGAATRTFDVETGMMVHPLWIPLVNFPLLETQSSPNEPLHDRRRKGAGLDFYGVREYRPGDSLRHIHWKSTAHGGRLLIREYEEQLASRLSIWIDGVEKVGEEPRTSFEDAVSCAASLVVYALETGHPVQLFCDSSEGTHHLFEPGKADALDWLSQIEGGGRRSMSRLAEDNAEEIRFRTTNVLVFPTTRRNSEELPKTVALLQSLGTRVIGVALSARTYANSPAALSKELEEAFLSSLSTNRVVVYRIEKDGDLAECLREPFVTG